MKIQNQVCSYEQSARLKELGIAQDGFFAWVKHSEIEHETIPFVDVAQDMCEYPHLEIVCTAFNVAELGAMLPPWHVTYKQSSGQFAPYRNGNGEFCIIEGLLPTVYDTEAIARAAMLIHFLVNGHTTPEECSSRLLNS